jgi:ribonuclease HI
VASLEASGVLAGLNFIAVACDHTNHAMEVASLEASGVLAGLKLAEQFGAHSLLVEPGSMEVVEAVQLRIEVLMQ